MTARLTIAAARPGMLVYFADDKKRCPDCFTIEEVDTSFGLVRINAATGDCGWWRVSAFAPADPQPVPADPPSPTLAALLVERAPELLEALTKWRAWFDGDGPYDDCDTDLNAAIERAGILAQEPRTTEREATISEGWWK